jgi:hypothetical protein
MFISYCDIEVTVVSSLGDEPAARGRNDRETHLPRPKREGTDIGRGPESGRWTLVTSKFMSRPCLAIAGLVPCLILVLLEPAQKAQ